VGAPLSDNEINENEILLRIAQGDEQAFRVLFDRYSRRLALHVFHLTDSAEIAEEVVQDSFLKIWMGREALVHVRDFSAYLFVISRNQALNALRSIARERRRRQDWALTHQEGNAIGDPDSLQGHYFTLIDEAVRQLPPQQQKVYLLNRHDRLSYREIAAEMDLSPETVKKYLQLAIGSISDHVRKNLDTWLFLATLTCLSKA